MRLQPRDRAREHGRERASGERPDERSERASTGRAIARAVGTLSPEVRAAFVLRAYHELSYLEIARELEIEVGTVKSRLRLAMGRLRQSLGDLI